MADTTNFALTKPTVGGSDDAWGGIVNTIVDDLDGLLGSVTALSGTTPTVDLSTRVRAFTLTTSGNTTFTFSGAATAFDAFVLKVEAGGTHTLTWPASVDWPLGTKPTDPASGETDVFVFQTFDGGTNWIGVRAVDAAA